MKDERSEHPYWIHESMSSASRLMVECLSPEFTSVIENLAEILSNRQIKRFYCVGTGSSYLAAIAQAFAFRYIDGMEATAWNSLEFRMYAPPEDGKGAALLLNSHSGKSPGDAETIKTAARRGMFTIAVTDIKGTALTDCADYVLLGPGGPKHEMPSTRAYSLAIYRVLLLCAKLALRVGQVYDGRTFLESLQALPALAEKMVRFYDERGPELAKQLLKASNYLVLTHGPNIATAQEAAMGLCQATGLPAQAFLLEEYIHGHIQGLPEGTEVLVLSPPGPCNARVTRFAQVMRKLGAHVSIFDGGLPNEPMEKSGGFWLPAGVHEILTPVVYCIPFWFIGYYLTLLHQGNPDSLRMTAPVFQNSGLAEYKKDFI